PGRGGRPPAPRHPGPVGARPRPPDLDPRVAGPSRRRRPVRRGPRRGPGRGAGGRDRARRRAVTGRSAARVALALAGLLAGCSRVEYTWAWHVVDPTTPAGWTNLQFLVAGVGLTAQLSLVSVVASVVLGLVVALAGFSRSRALRALNRCYVEALRNVP